jgi:hypothetical protein
MNESLDKETFVELAAELERLRRKVRDVRRLPHHHMLEILELRTQWSRAQANRLIKRVTELRELIDMRLRRLERLRARMRQIRGGAKPH